MYVLDIWRPGGGDGSRAGLYTARTQVSNPIRTGGPHPVRRT